MVISRALCPTISITVRGFTPWASSRDTQECLRLWRGTGRIPMHMGRPQ